MGPSHTTSSTKIAPATEDEKRQNALLEGMNMLNLEQSGYKANYNADTKSYTFEKIPLTPEQQTQQDQLTKLGDMAYNKMMGISSPETQAKVATTFQSQREKGNQELDRYLQEQGASRGLSLSDTPLLRESTLQKGNMETSLRGAEAASLLDEGNTQQNFGLALADFQNQLRQQAFVNRASIGSTAQQQGFGLAQTRRGQASTSQSTSNPGAYIGAGVGALGATAAIAGTAVGTTGATVGSTVAASVAAML